MPGLSLNRVRTVASYASYVRTIHTSVIFSKGVAIVPTTSDQSSTSVYIPKISTDLSMFKKVVFSGVQPTGTLHIGNYFGAVTNWLQLQEEALTRTFISIVDLHSITELRDPKETRENTFAMTASLLACGIDPEKCTLFLQSHVPEHAHLAWCLSNLVTLPQLQRQIHFKDKAKGYGKSADVPLGLMSYPVLQAADILLYRATHVPVGEDQKEHLSIARFIANKFNNYYRVNYFPLPETMFSKMPRLKSLRIPDKKMSKSDPNFKSRIEINDSPDEIRSKVKKALTDFVSLVFYDPEKRPAVSNLILLDSICSNQSIEQIIDDSHRKGLDTAKYKMEVADRIIVKLEPIYKEYNRLIDDKEYLSSVLKNGSMKVRPIAQKHIEQIEQIMGFVNG